MRQPRILKNGISKSISYVLILTLLGSIFSAALSSTGLLFQSSYAASNNISLEIDDIKYGQGDDVSISGSIEDRESGEDQVTIKVKDPSGHTDEDKDITLSSHDEFDMLYSIGNSADDGLYTVQVEYGTDRLYSFFIVDEDDDTVSVDTNHDSYSGGDNVIVSGKVSDLVSGEDVVEITIIDPNNDKILSSEDVTLGDGSGLDDDEYKYTFEDLDNDADPGRYAVIVEYVDNQEGSAIFTVEDGGSSGAEQITATLNKTTYKPGDTVTLSGTIDSVDNDLDLKVVVKDPTSHTIESDSSVDVANDGDFELTFDLDDNADEGKYSITITYGSDDLQLNFNVSESGSTTTSGLSVKLNKASYLAGETITVTGTVPKVVKDEQVNVLLYTKGSVFGGAAAYVDPQADKTYTATLKLKSDLKVEDGYEVRVDYNGEEAKAAFAITGQTTGSDVLTVKTDKPKYPMDSTVKISGKVSTSELRDGILLLIQVFNPEQAAYRFDQVEVQDDGSYTYSLPIGGKLGTSGVYDVRASYNGKVVKTTFEITGGRASYSLKAAGQTYLIQYDITNGKIKSMFVNENEKKLVIAIDAQENDGQLTLVLPRTVIDAVDSGKDAKYLIGTTDIETGASNDNVSANESEKTSDTRTIVVNYAKGTDLVEITGTTVVPEFGSIAAIVLAVAIVAIILVTARFRGGVTGSSNSRLLGLS